MSIPTQLSMHGFIATAPQISTTNGGVSRLYLRVGVEHYRKEHDGNFTKLNSTFHDLVAFGKSAERAHAQFKVGDSFVASGYINTYTMERNGASDQREEFVARRIGHDVARTTYEVSRSPSRQRDPAAVTHSVVSAPAHTLER